MSICKGPISVRLLPSPISSWTRASFVPLTSAWYTKYLQFQIFRHLRRKARYLSFSPESADFHGMPVVNIFTLYLYNSWE